MIVNCALCHGDVASATDVAAKGSRNDALREEIKRLTLECEELEEEIKQVQDSHADAVEIKPNVLLSDSDRLLDKSSFVGMQIEVMDMRVELEVMEREKQRHGVLNGRYPQLWSAAAQQEVEHWPEEKKRSDEARRCLKQELERSVQRERDCLEAQRALLREMDSAIEEVVAMRERNEAKKMYYMSAKPLAATRRLQADLYYKKGLAVIGRLVSTHLSPSASLYRTQQGPVLPPLTQHHQEPLQTLEDLLNALFSPSGPYMAIKSHHWPPFLQLLLDNRLCLRHPDKAMIALRPFHLL